MYHRANKFNDSGEACVCFYRELVQSCLRNGMSAKESMERFYCRIRKKFDIGIYYASAQSMEFTR